MNAVCTVKLLNTGCCILHMYSVALFPHSFLCPCLLLRSVSLSSLYSLLKARLCPYFYLCSYQVGVNMHSELCSATPSFSSSVSLSVHSVVPGSRSWRIQQHHCFHFPHNEGPQRGNEGWRWELNCSFGLKINFHLIHLQPEKADTVLLSACRAGSVDNQHFLSTHLKCDM